MRWNERFELNRLLRMALLPAKKGEMLLENDIAFLQEDDPLDSISKFADIARPGIGKDALFSFSGDLNKPLFKLFIKSTDKKLKKRENILLPVPHGRNV